jgi:hypothetical protein
MALSPGAALGSRIAAASLLALFAAASGAQTRFAVSADGQEVADSTTRLTWRRCVEGMRWDGKTCGGKAATYKYAGAKQAAETAASGGKAWRIPSREELVALVDKTSKKKPLIDAKAFPNTPKAAFWALREGSDDDLNAWLVSFSTGRVSGNAGQKKFPLRLVRSGS